MQKVILIGRHKLSGEENLEIIEQKNINFPSTSNECEPIIHALLEEAKSQNAALVFQAMPAQVSICVANIINDDTEYQAGGIVSIPGERLAGVTKVFDSDHQFIAELVEEVAKFANPRAKTEIDGLSCKVTVDPPMRFKFSHIEWF